MKEEADDTEIITVWFPLRDATEENGCLAVVPRSHQEGLVPTARPIIWLPGFTSNSESLMVDQYYRFP